MIGLRVAILAAATLICAGVQAAEFNVADGDVAGLIAAIEAANASGEPDTINLAADGDYVLTQAHSTGQGLPASTGVLTVNGNGATIERSGAPDTPEFRIFTNDGDLTLNDLIMKNGRSDSGGAVRNNADATLALNGCQVLDSGSTAGVSSGGGVWSGARSVLNVTDSIFNGNFSGSLGGGAMLIGSATGPAMVTIVNSSLTENSAGSGGAIRSNGAELSIFDSLLEDNVATSTVGGAIEIATDSTVTLTRTVVAGNQADSFGGGIRVNRGALMLIDSWIDGNTSGSSGGGVRFSQPSVPPLSMIRGTTFSNNTTLGSSAFGGGLSHLFPNLIVENSTFSGNSVPLRGGGIHLAAGNDDAFAALINVTVADNSAPEGAGVFRATSTFGSAVVELSNTLVSNPGGGGADIQGPYTDLGFNLVRDGSGVTHPTSLMGDPMIGPLADNLGPTLTHALLLGSPAVDAGDCFGGTITVDQRGTPRPQGPACDIGAFELDDLIFADGFESS